MRKWIVIGLAACFALIFILHGEINIKPESKNNDYQKLNQSLNTVEINPSPKPVEEEKYNPTFELLYKGYMDGVEFGIGTDGAEIIKKWGEPDIKDNFIGGLLLSYDDTYFFTDGLIQNDGSTTYGNLSGIYYTGDDTIYNIQMGMTSEQVEDILGKADEIYTSHNSELFSDDNIIMKYYAGGYSAIFEVDDLSERVRSISMWKED